MRTNVQRQPAAPQPLKDLSARLGANPLLVQASTGNTSIKIKDLLWIKASGKWLSQANAHDVLVSVTLSRARQCLRENLPIPETQTASPDGNRASIETAMHVALPQKVVLHIHSVNAIAWAVREDAPRQLKSRLAGLPWQWIPYTTSGPALARRVEQAFTQLSRADVFVLGNHGLVVCGDTYSAAEQLLAEVENRLAIEPRPAPIPDLGLLQHVSARSGYSLPASDEVHALATDHASRSILAGGVLYPCQAIFLSNSLFHLCDGQGVLCSHPLTPLEEQTLIGLTNVVRRIDPAAPIRYLTASELHALSNQEADHYRQMAAAGEMAMLATRK